MATNKLSERITCEICNGIIAWKFVTDHMMKIHGLEKQKAVLESVHLRYKISNETISQIIVDYESGGSLPSLANKYNISACAIDKIVQAKYGKRRSISESRKFALEKYKLSCLEKYGVDNVSKLESIKSKKAETFLSNYGVDNVFKAEEFKTQLNEMMMKKYGVRRITAPMVKSFRPLTENLVETWLQEHEIPYARSFYIKGKQFDFLIPDVKIVIEVHGNFWHANPLIYKAEDLLPHPEPTGLIAASELWKRDERKKELAEKNGYKYYVIWESDLAIKQSKQTKQTIQEETKRKLIHEYQTRKIEIDQENHESIKTV
jgi:G:T-mismatch repair DNA endonuclease (very short patch repair protein)